MTATTILRRALEVARHEGVLSTEEWATAHAWLDEGATDDPSTVYHTIDTWRRLAEQGRAQRQRWQR